MKNTSIQFNRIIQLFGILSFIGSAIAQTTGNVQSPTSPLQSGSGISNQPNLQVNPNAPNPVLPDRSGQSVTQNQFGSSTAGNFGGTTSFPTNSFDSSSGSNLNTDTFNSNFGTSGNLGTSGNQAGIANPSRGGATSDIGSSSTVAPNTATGVNPDTSIGR